MKLLIYCGITIGGILGSYIPVWLTGANMFSFISLMSGTIGSLLGLFIGFKIGQNMDV